MNKNSSNTTFNPRSWSLGRFLSLTALAGVCLAAPHATHAALLAYEGFNYTTGSGNLTGLSGGFGWLGAWQGFAARDDASRWRGSLLFHFGLALAFLAKGPPGLLPLAAMLAFDLLQPRAQRRRVFDPAGIALFLAIAAPWFIAVTRANPGLLGYFVGDEVVNRVASDEFNRNGQWYGLEVLMQYGAPISADPAVKRVGIGRAVFVRREDAGQVLEVARGVGSGDNANG